MTTNARDAQLDADLAAARQSTRRQALILAGAIGVLALIAAGTNALTIATGQASGSDLTVAIGQGLLGLLGLASAALLILRPRQGWMLALAWALIQIPFYAWSPAGSPTTQIVSLPITMSDSTKVNGVVTAYSAIGINAVGIIFAVWLRAWRSRFEA
jgi:hypothetical protein